MSETIVPGPITAESEFQGGLTGACGPNACSAAGRWADQIASPTSSDNTVAMNYWLQHIVNSPNGVSTLEELKSLMRLLHYTVLERDTSVPVATWVTRMAGTNAVICFYENAQVLHDVITGGGMDAHGLQGHFNCVFGKNTGGTSPHFGGRSVPAGFIVSDGDSDVQNLVNGVLHHRGINTQMVYYSTANVQQAQLTDAFAVTIRAGTKVTIPAGWKDDGTTLTAPNGIVVVKGFRDWILNKPWDSADYPLDAEHVITSGSIEPGNPSIGPGSRQDFRMTSLGWTSAKGVYSIWTGQDILALQAQVKSIQADVTLLTTQVSSLAATVAKLQKDSGLA